MKCVAFFVLVVAPGVSAIASFGEAEWNEWKRSALQHFEENKAMFKKPHLEIDSRMTQYRYNGKSYPGMLFHNQIVPAIQIGAHRHPACIYDGRLRRAVVRGKEIICATFEQKDIIFSGASAAENRDQQAAVSQERARAEPPPESHPTVKKRAAGAPSKKKKRAVVPLPSGPTRQNGGKKAASAAAPESVKAATPATAKTKAAEGPTRLSAVSINLARSNSRRLNIRRGTMVEVQLGEIVKSSDRNDTEFVLLNSALTTDGELVHSGAQVYCQKYSTVETGRIQFSCRDLIMSDETYLVNAVIYGSDFQAGLAGEVDRQVSENIAAAGVNQSLGALVSNAADSIHADAGKVVGAGADSLKKNARRQVIVTIYPQNAWLKFQK